MSDSVQADDLLLLGPLTMWQESGTLASTDPSFSRRLMIFLRTTSAPRSNASAFAIGKSIRRCFSNVRFRAHSGHPPQVTRTSAFGDFRSFVLMVLESQRTGFSRWQYRVAGIDAYGTSFAISSIPRYFPDTLLYS